MQKLPYLLMAMFWASNFVWATDPFAGNWTLSVKRSKYPPGSRPKSMMINMEAIDHGIRYYSETTYPNGSSCHSQYTADYNGTQVIVSGDHGLLLPVSLKQLDSNTLVASYTRALQVVATSRRVVSKDGRLMTITTTSRDGSGKNVASVGVYERKGPAVNRHEFARKGGSHL
jgi:hypothetical protein